MICRSITPAKSDLYGDRNALDGCLVQGGFYRAMMDVRDIVVDDVLMAHKAYPQYKIVSVGHLLGGAVAAIMGVELRNHNLVVDIACIPLLGGALMYRDG